MCCRVRGAVQTEERSNVQFGEGGAILPGPTRSPLGNGADLGETRLRANADSDEDVLFRSVIHEADFDAIEEVEAVARSLRRVALQYSVLIIALLLSVPALSWLAPWWFARPIWGGLTLNFIVVAVLLHVAFLAVAIAYVRVANRSEEEMLGRPERGD